MEVKCQLGDCSKIFTLNPSYHGPTQKYCSRYCYNLAKSRRFNLAHGEEKKLRDKTRHKITCKFCGKDALRDKKTREYCNSKCSSASRKKFLDIPDCLESASRKLDKNLGYVRVYVPMHPEANTWGYVYEHRVVAEQIIGRRLIKGEIVHHKNGKRWDNRPENLEVMTYEEHGKLHGQRLEDLSI